MPKITLKEIAESLHISKMTLYRAMNGSASVSDATRRRVVNALSSGGYYSRVIRKPQRLVLDISDSSYLSYWGTRLLERVSRLDFQLSVTNHHRDRAAFREALADAEIAVFLSIPSNEMLEQVREWNPDAFLVNLFGGIRARGADVSIDPDNVGGGELAAEHLFANGHRRHVAVFDAPPPSQEVRADAFSARLRRLAPDCRIDYHHPAGALSEQQAIFAAYAKEHKLPSAIFCTNGVIAYTLCTGVLWSSTDPRIRELGVVGYDHEKYLEIKLPRPIDRIVFSPEQVIRWGEYYIQNRPLLDDFEPLHTFTASQLEINGSVRNLLS